MNGTSTVSSLGLVLVLAGCAASPVSPPPEEPAGPAYHQLMAEIAARRGAPATAAAEYVDAAERSDDARLAEQATDYAFSHGFDALALRAARRWTQLDPANPTARLYLARLLVRAHDVAGATAEARAALALPGADGVTDFAQLAAELGEERNAEGVTQVLSRLVALGAEGAPPRLALAAAALRSGDLDLALESAYSAQNSDQAAGMEEEIGLLVARIRMARGEEAGALERLSRLVEADASIEAGMEYARVLATLGRHGEALQALDDLSRRHGDAPGIRRLRALVHLDAGDGAAAWSIIGELIREGEFADELLFFLGDASVKQDRIDQAIEFYQRVPEGDYLLAAQAALVRLVEERDGVDAALEGLRDAAADYPRFVIEFDRLQVALLERAGRVPEALALLDVALAHRPADVELRLNRATLRERSGDLDGALRDMGVAVAIAPDDAAALNAYGYTLTNRTRRHAEAHQLIRRALEREPDSAAILDSYGWVLFRRGRLPEARSYLQFAYSRMPDPEIAAHLGEVMWRQGDVEAARRLWADAREKAPESAPLNETMRRFIAPGDG
jgi:tetratricopeptide (TPR) repeat protein